VTDIVSAAIESTHVGLQDKVAAIFQQMDLSESTIAQYQSESVVFISWLEKRTLHLGTLLEWKKYLKGRPDLAIATKAKQLTIARCLFREMYRLGLLPKDLSVGVRGFKVKKLHRTTPITEAELSCVLGYIETDTADPRARVAITLMYRQGLRRVELARLQIEDIDLSKKTARVLGKGQDDYTPIDLHPITVSVLDAYLVSNDLKSGPLFPSPYKPGLSLTENAIWRLITKVHDKFGINATPHAYRKAFVTALIQRTNLNILEVAEYTRHASVETVRIYYSRLDKEKTLPAYYDALS